MHFRRESSATWSHSTVLHTNRTINSLSHTLNVERLWTCREFHIKSIQRDVLPRLTNSFDRVFYTTTNVLELNFDTNGTGTAKGWEVAYKAIPNPLNFDLYERYEVVKEQEEARGASAWRFVAGIINVSGHHIDEPYIELPLLGHHMSRDDELLALDGASLAESQVTAFRRDILLIEEVRRVRQALPNADRAHLSTFVSIFYSHESTQVSTIPSVSGRIN